MSDKDDVGSLVQSTVEHKDYMLSDGRKLKVEEYPELFKIIEHLYTDTPTETHFNIPDLKTSGIVNNYIKVK